MPKRAIIFANGRMENIQESSLDFTHSDLIIAADGGRYHCETLGIRPDVIIGDLDSINQDEIASLRDAGLEIIQYPTHKDQTDLELALRYAVQREVNVVTIIGGLGARWDMTLANILLLTQPAYSGIRARLIDGPQELALIQAGNEVILEADPGDTISLLPLAGDACGISTDGLEYPLHEETLHFGSTRGVSNVFLDKRARIFYKEGILLYILDHGKNSMVKEE